MLGIRIPYPIQATSKWRPKMKKLRDFRQCVGSDKIISGSGSDFEGISDLILDPGQYLTFLTSQMKKLFENI